MKNTAQKLSKEDVLATIRAKRLMPVVRVISAEQAFCAAKGVVNAGFPLIEITMTVPGALEIIQQLSSAYKNTLIVGAGTILSAETCSLAISAGAEFIVSPSYDASVIETANSHNTACIAGALTPTEIVTAHKTGADMVKVFPCGLVGGSRYIRVLRGPLPDIELVPSSGVNKETVSDFLQAGSAAVAIGEPIFEKHALETGDYQAIADRAAYFHQICRID